MTTRSNSAHEPSILFSTAAAKDVDAHIKGTSAVQTAAAAFMFRHLSLVANASKQSPVVKLSDLADGDARTMYQSDLIKEFAVPRMSVKENHKAADVARNHTQHARERGLISRALTLAHSLATFNVTVEHHWSDKVGMFIVPADMFLSPGQAYSGRVKLIPLDGNGIGITYGDRNERQTTIKASVEQLRVAAFARAGKVATARGKKGATASVAHGTAGTVQAGAGVDGNTAFTTWSMDKLLSSAALLLNRIEAIVADGKEGATPVRYSDLSQAMRNSLEAIVIFRDECKAAEQASEVKAA